MTFVFEYSRVYKFLLCPAQPRLKLHLSRLQAGFNGTSDICLISGEQKNSQKVLKIRSSHFVVAAFFAILSPEEKNIKLHVMPKQLRAYEGCDN